MKTNYSNVKIPLNTIVGATVQALSAKQGVSLTRVTEDGRDDLIITRAGKPTVHLAWSQVKGGFVQDGVIPAGPAKPRSTDFGALPEGEEAADTGEPEDDTVRLGKPRVTRVKAPAPAPAAAGDDIDAVLAAHEGDEDGEPVDDTVRLMAPKKRARKKASE